MKKLIVVIALSLFAYDSLSNMYDAGVEQVKTAAEYRLDRINNI